MTEAGRAQRSALARFEQAKLILVIDQLEELFTVTGISPDDRRLFIQLLAGLARSGAVWVVATMRADFWHSHRGRNPELIALTEGQGCIDIAAAVAGELAEMIRKPAQAAGLSFEVHPARAVWGSMRYWLNMPPPSQACCRCSRSRSRRFTQGVTKRGGRVLSFASYDALGGLEGAIATRADEVVGRLARPRRGGAAAGAARARDRCRSCGRRR